MPDGKSNTTKVRLPDPADYPTYGAWFRALEAADEAIKREAWDAHDAENRERANAKR